MKAFGSARRPRMHLIGWADVVAAKWELRLMERLDLASMGQLVAYDVVDDVASEYHMLDEEDFEGDEFLEEAKKVRQHSHQSRHRRTTMMTMATRSCCC